MTDRSIAAMIPFIGLFDPFSTVTSTGTISPGHQALAGMRAERLMGLLLQQRQHIVLVWRVLTSLRYCGMFVSTKSIIVMGLYVRWLKRIPGRSSSAVR